MNRTPAVDLVNGGDATERRRVLLRCCGSERWADALSSQAPWLDPDALFRGAEDAMNALEPDDWRRALQAEDSVVPQGDSGEDAEAGTRAAAGTALRLYHQRFGFPFVTALPRMQPDELLMRARIRLGNDEEAEFATAVEELRRLVRQRLRGLLEQSGAGPA